MRRAWLVAVGIALATSEASASRCNDSRVSHARDRMLPRKGVIFVRDTASLEDERFRIPWTWIGGEGRETRTRITDDLIRIDYEATTARALAVDRQEYALVPTWPRMTPFVVRGVDDERRRRNSSAIRRHNVILEITEQPAAFRVRWTYDGTTQEAIYIPWAPPPPWGFAQLRLGKECALTFVPIDELHDGVRLELSAIGFDGTEVPVLGLPEYVAAGDFPKRVDEMDPEAFGLLMIVAGIVAVIGVCGYSTSRRQQPLPRR